ncbi:hypothetical protein Rsub_06307 [Raphidocelis subcapitata]|uniref:G-patch domain-containing protein n=1 Tax=Raphidocelis subcapitata TaxID=307507 RepID=A0A2V0P8V0_9CHLO|nr:hypothetical protein Rsub_06307 [Raphidocelis subcapitata]|eukprot:GBF93587.1 hypothetical protein Rsub_06307 [Raphidocelis subcapitata]
MKLPEGYVPGVGVPKQKGGFGGFGQKMLERMGWERGQGLGKEKKGMSEAIAVSKKEDALGVGATQTGWKWDWKYWEDAYSRGLQSVAHKGSSDSDDDSDGSSTSSSGSERRPGGGGSGSESDDDEPGSGGGASSDGSSDDEPALDRLMACAVAVNRDGTLATASSHELQIARSLSKDPRGWAGRFSGREGKMARIRAQEEQQAAEARSKLGLTPAPSGGAASGGGGGAASNGAPSKKRKTDAAGTDTDAAGGATDADSKRRSKKSKRAAEEQQKQQQQQQQQQRAEGSKKKDKKKKSKNGSEKQEQGSKQAGPNPSEQQQSAGQEQQRQQPARKPRVIVVALKGRDATWVEPFVPTPATGWWGAKTFSSAGRLEGMEDEQPQQQAEAGAAPPSKARAAFDEDTQAALYNKLQAAQRQGKRGLAGRGEIKIAGGNWEGQKTTFAEDEGGEGGGLGAAEAEAEAGAAAAAAAGDGGKRNKRSKQRSRDGDGGAAAAAAAAVAAAAAAAAAGAAADGGGAASSAAKRVKWAKLAVAELERAPKRRLRWSALWAALAQQDAAAASRSGAAEAEQQAWQRIQSSSRFVVDGRKVALAAKS